MLEIQRRPGVSEQHRTLLVADAAFEDLGEVRLNKLLTRVAFRDGHVRDLDGVTALQNVRLSGANHSETGTAEQCASRILGKIIGLIEEIDALALDRGVE